MNKKHKKVCTTLNHIEHLLILASAITGCVSIFSFDFLLGIPIQGRRIQGAMRAQAPLF